MSGEHKTATEFYDELCGVDGDGLGEGEEAYEGEHEYGYWLFNPNTIEVIEPAQKRGA